MSTLITGGYGLIGANVALALVAGGEQAVAYDQGPPDAAVSAFFATEREPITCVAGDVSSLAHLLTTIRDHGITRIVHAAAIVSEARCRDLPAEAVRVNVQGTQAVLEAARLAGVRRVLYVSSGSIFGAATGTRPLREDDVPSPRGVYATTKWMAENLCLGYYHVYGLDVRIVRLSWVYGPEPRGPRADPLRGPIPYLIARLAAGRDVHEASGADFTANFSYAGDVAAGMVRLLSADRLPHQLYHLSSGALFSTADVASVLRRLFPGQEVEVGPGMEPYVRQAPLRGPLAIDRITGDLGPLSLHSLEDALAEYAGWARRMVKNGGT